MTVEEGLVALVALGAFVLLFMGLAQALDTPPAPPRRRRAPAPAAPGPEPAEEFPPPASAAAGGDAPPAPAPARAADDSAEESVSPFFPRRARGPAPLLGPAGLEEGAGERTEAPAPPPGRRLQRVDGPRSRWGERPEAGGIVAPPPSDAAGAATAAPPASPEGMVAEAPTSGVAPAAAPPAPGRAGVPATTVVPAPGPAEPAEARDEAARAGAVPMAALAEPPPVVALVPAPVEERPEPAPAVAPVSATIEEHRERAPAAASVSATIEERPEFAPPAAPATAAIEERPEPAPAAAPVSAAGEERREPGADLRPARAGAGAEDVEPASAATAALPPAPAEPAPDAVPAAARAQAAPSAPGPTAGPPVVAPRPRQRRPRGGAGPSRVQAEIAAALAGAPEAEASPAAGPSVAERCLDLLSQGEYAQVLERVEPVLRRHPGAALAGPAAYERTLLWVVTGLTRRALGDGAGARAAWDSALRFLPRPHEAVGAAAAAGAAAALARRLLEAAAPGPEGDRPLPELRLACGLAAAVAQARPEDAAARDLGETAGAALASACAARAQGLLHRREFAAAHRLLEDSMAERGLPPEASDGLRELYWTSLTGEVGRLTGQALAPEADADPVEPLERAERLVRAVPAGTVSAERAADLGRRLWWAYTRLGEARREAGDLEGALQALFEALRVGAAADPERGAETRRAVVETLDALVERWGEGIGRLADEGEREAAAGELGQMTDALDRALERGITADELAGSLERRRALAVRVGGVATS